MSLADPRGSAETNQTLGRSLKISFRSSYTVFPSVARTQRYPRSSSTLEFHESIACVGHAQAHGRIRARPLDSRVAVLARMLLIQPTDDDEVWKTMCVNTTAVQVS